MLWHLDPRQGSGVTGNLLGFMSLDLSDIFSSCSESSGRSMLSLPCDKGSLDLSLLEDRPRLHAVLLFHRKPKSLGKQKEL